MKHRPEAQTYAAHQKRWRKVLNDIIDRTPNSLGLPMSEIIKRFNRSAKALGYRRAKLVDGGVEFG